MHVEMLLGLPMIDIYAKISLAVPTFHGSQCYGNFFQRNKDVPLKNNFYLQTWYIQVKKYHVLTTI